LETVADELDGTENEANHSGMLTRIGANCQNARILWRVAKVLPGTKIAMVGMTKNRIVPGKIARAYGKGTLRPLWKYDLGPETRWKRNHQMGRITAPPMFWYRKA
jgi:hypothetical protein